MSTRTLVPLSLDMSLLLCYTVSDMLKEVLKEVHSRRQREFLAMRIAGLDKRTTMTVLSIPEGSYKRWVSQPSFRDIYRRIAELSAEYKEEAIRLLRRNNQLAAVLLEKDIIQRMKEEIESGEYELVRTHLGREVYSKLVSELDKAPVYQSLTWEQRIYSELKEQRQLEEGEVIEGEGDEEQLRNDCSLVTVVGSR